MFESADGGAVPLSDPAIDNGGDGALVKRRCARDPLPEARLAPDSGPKQNAGEGYRRKFEVIQWEEQ
jgi:hypothetical protein